MEATKSEAERRAFKKNGSLRRTSETGKREIKTEANKKDDNREKKSHLSK